MKQHASVLMLLCRSTVFKILGLFALMTAVEVGLFAWRGRYTPGLEQMVDAAWLRWVFGGALLLLTLILMSTLCESSGKLDYTLRRLRISRRSLFAWQAGYNAVCYFLLLAVQLFVVMLLCRIWMGHQETVSNQAVFLAFYRSEFLHSLLPLSDSSRHLRNIVYFICMSVAAACVPVCHRRGKNSFGAGALAGVLLVNFSKEIGAINSDALMIVIGIAGMFISLVRAWGDDYENED